MKFNFAFFLGALLIFAGIFFLLDYTMMGLQGLDLIFDHDS